MRADVDLDLRWLRSFVAVADHGGFQQAALELRLSQPTVSGHLKALERSVGRPLIDRRTRPVALTPAGKVFIRHARLVLGEVAAGVRRLRNQNGGPHRGTVVIGTYPSASAGYLPHLMRLARDLHPGVEIRLEEMSGGEMEAAAEAGRLDVFLRQAEPPLSRRRYGGELLWRERFLIAIPPGHPWAADVDRPVDPEELVHERLIMTGQFQAESLLGHPFWRDLGRYPEVPHRVRHPQSLLALVELGSDPGLTTELPVALFAGAGVVFRPIAHPAAVRDVYANWPLSRPLSGPAKSIVDLMLTHPTPPALSGRAVFEGAISPE